MIVTAKFTGEPSREMGYNPGETYRLKLIFPSNPRIMLKILRLDGNDKMVSESACSYESIRSFLGNWTNVSKY